MASLRHRRGIAVAEAEEEYSDDDDSGSGTTAAGTDYTATEGEDLEEEDDEEEEEEEDHGMMHLGLHSMTAKGIQHLCSELLEIKKASEQDFRANVYLSYLSFIRMFQEAGDLDKDVHHLKRQVMAHRRLIQHLTTNCFYSIPPMLLAGGSSSGPNNHSIRTMAMEMVDVEEDLELDVLLSEHRIEQALELLELQGQEALHSSTSSSGARKRKARVADRLASVAENPRTPRAELLKALAGLCRLGDAERANHLLFNYFHTRTMRRPPPPQIKDLALMVLSSIAQASRGFVALHGHPSPYTPQLVRWAREKMEDLGNAFTEFVVRSMSMPGTGTCSCLALALEAAECAVSSCSLLVLRRLDVATEQDVVRLVVAPCLREAVAMYGRHLKEVVRLLVASDAAQADTTCCSTAASTLFLTMPQQLQVAEQQYCLLTSSGRKFVTLIQEVLEDVAWPLLNLNLEMTNDESSSSVVALQLVAELFREYMHSIVELITIPGGKEEDMNVMGEENKYMWQISILINCTTLVSLFPIVARGISSSNSDDDDAAAHQHRQQAAVDSLVSLIKEAAGQVWSCFCQHFIRDTIVVLLSSSAAANVHHTRQPQGVMMMPSLAFQTVFLRVRRLTKHAAAGTSSTSAMVKRLLQELMEAIISWLSGNLLDVHQQQVQLQQVQLDVHFLLEFAQLGGFSSEKMRSSALELLRRAAQEIISQQQGVEDEGFGWAADAAKQAVQALLIMEGSDSDGQHAAAAAAAATTSASSEEEDDEDESGGGAAKSSDELFISIEEDEEEEEDAQ
ncbi:hypothetical protein BS78_K284100 [Paspalum vaginatum]|uniref:Exocyst component Exo84 C-terminal domain-containing protein n=1 Tax=Paspalum vaginatum TaxID=158149 RepID=A0A9W7XA39_9POAL|nr:hypothetical protein BS78_K284100 [Paspalum vaginatum]KAJ1255140.1 hypothetical protein BS78_K284100 [Paspalum vaginatum]